MTKIFINILNWNRKEETLECLKSLEKLKINKNIDLNILVIDNGSTDGSLRALKNYSVLKNKKNLGFAEGNNKGMKYALKQGADYIILLNNDAYVDKNLLIEMLKVFEDKNRKKVGAVSPLIYFAKGFEFHKDRYKKADLGKVIWSAGGSIDWDNVFGVNAHVNEVDTGKLKKREIEFATGACVMYSREALKKAGFFNDKYFMYYEDVDLSVRLRKKGFKIIFTPYAKLWHKVAQSSGIGSGLNDYFIARNRMLFGMKYARLRTKFALIREAFKLFFTGRQWQRMGIYDYFIGNFWKGSWK